MKIGYARVSSTGQNEAAQVGILNKHGIEELFVDKASGTSRDGRPALANAIKFARKGDALVVTRLDRLARSVIDLHSIAQELQAKKIDLVVTEQSIDTATPDGTNRWRAPIIALAEGRYKGRPATVDAEAIRAALAAGEKPTAVAKRFNVARSTVYRVAPQVS